MGLNFNMYVGDDTGLVKKVRMVYSYQTDIVGSYMKDDSFKPPDEEGIKDDDEEKRKRMQEDYSVATSYDKDGQPLFKVMQKAISAK
jgi:hypothetical protein